MKKFLIPLLLVCSVVLLSGCGNKEEAAAPETVEEPVIEEVQETMVEEPVVEVVEQPAEEQPVENPEEQPME